MIFIFTANIWSSYLILEMKMEDFFPHCYLFVILHVKHVNWRRHYQNNCDPTALMCTKTKPTSCCWPSHSCCIHLKDCVTKAYLLSKWKANQSGLATYLRWEHDDSRLVLTFSVTMSLGHQEILDNSSSVHVWGYKDSVWWWTHFRASVFGELGIKPHLLNCCSDHRLEHLIIFDSLHLYFCSFVWHAPNESPVPDSQESPSQTEVQKMVSSHPS